MASSGCGSAPKARSPNAQWRCSAEIWRHQLQHGAFLEPSVFCMRGGRIGGRFLPILPVQQKAISDQLTGPKSCACAGTDGGGYTTSVPIKMRSLSPLHDLSPIISIVLFHASLFMDSIPSIQLTALGLALMLYLLILHSAPPIHAFRIKLVKLVFSLPMHWQHTLPSPSSSSLLET